MLPRDLSGIDVFHLVTDRALRAHGLPGNGCVYVVELDGRLDPAGFARRMGRAVALMPELSLRLSAPLLARPRWVAGAAPKVGVVERDGEALALGLERLAEGTTGDAPLAIDLVRRSSGDLVVLRWFHSLVDARGAERLVRWLGSGEGDEPEPPPPHEERFGDADGRVTGLPRDERIALARAYTQHVQRLGSVPAASLAHGVTRAVLRAGSTTAVRVVLDPDATRAFDRRVRQQAKLAETAVMVLASARVVASLLVDRGLSPPRLLVPLPLSLDPKTGARRLLGNNLTMMHFALDAADLRDDARALASLAEQQRAIVRDRLDVAMLAGLDLTRRLPRFAYERVMQSPFVDEISSLVASNPGVVALDRFAGLPVRDAFPLPAVVTPPGFQVVFTRHGGRLSALAIFRESLLPRDGGVTVERRLRGALAGAPEG